MQNNDTWSFDNLTPPRLIYRWKLNMTTKKKISPLIFYTGTPNSPFPVDLKPVLTLNAFAYIPNMNSYIHGRIIHISVPPHIPQIHIMHETFPWKLSLEKMLDVFRCIDSISNS